MVDWKRVAESVRLLRGWIKRLKHNVDVKSPLAAYVYAETIESELKTLKDLLEKEAPKETLFFKHLKIMEVLTPEMVEDLWGKFSAKLKEAGIDPEKYRERFENLVDRSMGFEDNLEVLMDEAKLIILEEKHPPLRLKRHQSLMERLVKAREKVDWRAASEAVLSLGYLVELMRDAVKAEDVVGFYRLAKRMEEALETLANHIKTVAPEIVEATEKFRKI